MSYNQDIAEPLAAVEKWPIKPEYEAYKKVFEEYREKRADLFTTLVNIVAQPDQDVSSVWKAWLDMGVIALGQIRDTLPLAGSDPNLGLQDWSDRETKIYEVLKAEDFLRTRLTLIAKKEELIQAGKVLKELSDQFFAETSARNAEMDKAAAATREKVGEYATVAAGVTGGIALAGTGLIQFISGNLAIMLGLAKTTLERYDQGRQALRDKKQTNELLKKIVEAFGDLAKEDQEEKVRNIAGEAKLEAIAGSEDFSNLIENLIDSWRRAHVEPAEAAAKEFGELLRKGIGDHSEEKTEEISKLKFLAAQQEAVVETTDSIESESLKPFEDAMNEMLREGDEKQEISRILNEIRENMKRLKEEEGGDFIEYQGETESLAQLLQFS